MLVPTLETERLTLRGWRETDIDGYAALMGDPVASRFIGGPLSMDDAWRKMACYVGHWHWRGYGPFVLEDKTSGRFAGFCGPWFPFGWPEAEISWSLLPAYQGRGLASEAAARALEYAFDELGWHTAISPIAPANTPSIRVAERLGARLDGTTEIRGAVSQVWRHPAPSRSPQTQR